MDFKKVMTMIDDISHHLPEQKYIEIVNDLKKQYDNANDDTDDYDDYDYYYFDELFRQLEYDLYYYIEKKIILFKDDDIDEAIDIFNHNFQYGIDKIIIFHTENKIDKIENSHMIWGFIDFVNDKKNRIENMVGKCNDFYYNDLLNRDYYIGLFGELALESADWYLRQKFQSTRYIDRCWSKLCLEYDKYCYDGLYCDYYFLKYIQFPKNYFDDMTTESFEHPDELQYHYEF